MLTHKSSAFVKQELNVSTKQEFLVLIGILCGTWTRSKYLLQLEMGVPLSMWLPCVLELVLLGDTMLDFEISVTEG